MQCQPVCDDLAGSAGVPAIEQLQQLTCRSSHLGLSFGGAAAVAHGAGAPEFFEWKGRGSPKDFYTCVEGGAQACFLKMTPIIKQQPPNTSINLHSGQTSGSALKLRVALLKMGEFVKSANRFTSPLL